VDFVYASRLGGAAEQLDLQVDRDPQVLPVLLASPLVSGRWQHPGDDVLRRALPWFESPLVFLHSAEAMESESTRRAERRIWRV
jgi:hypothetical protein